MLFCIYGTDKADSLDVRLANRTAHLTYWGEAGCVKLGGPFTSDDGEQMLGSMLVVDVENRAAVESLVANDPYTLACLFDSVDIRAWKWLLK